MESGDSTNVATRRSTRQSTTRVVNVEARGPIKRTRSRTASIAKEAVENGAKVTNTQSGDKGSPNKKRRLEEDEGMDGDADDCMDVEPEAHLEKQTLQDMGLSPDSHHPCPQPELFTRSTQLAEQLEVNSLTPYVLLTRSQSGQKEDLGNKPLESSRSQRVFSAKSALKLATQEDRPQMERTKSRTITDYQMTMAKARTTGVPKSNHDVVVRHSKSGVPYTRQQHLNNISQQKQLVQRKSSVVKKSVEEKCKSVKVTHGLSLRGFCWYLTRLVCLVLLSAFVLMAYKKAPALQNLTGEGEHLTKKVNPAEFSAKWSDLQSQFPGQRPELWKRSRIHLERHLQTARPTEPVSLILAAGRGAERTLRCLAQGLATAFSAAHNGSVLHIDGAAAAGQDSDRVKMDIDSALRGAFGEGGERPAAVIHRFEELPPGSTLIFYRYCDHENAAYKQVFLAFTVLLPQDHLETQHSLKEVEEMVQDHIAERFVGSGGRPAYNSMDADKLSGLWSRISHLILPVAAESQVELNGC